MKRISNRGQGDVVKSKIEAAQLTYAAVLCITVSLLVLYYLNDRHEVFLSGDKARRAMQFEATVLTQQWQGGPGRHNPLATGTQQAAAAQTGLDPGQQALAHDPTSAAAHNTSAPVTWRVLESTEMPGQLVTLEPGPSYYTTTQDGCSAACAQHVPLSPSNQTCNVWTWCGDEGLCGNSYMQCWLRHLAEPHSQQPEQSGPKVGWTSGMLGAAPPPAAAADTPDPGRKFHVVMTSGSQLYGRWQTRIHYYWYLKVKAECEQQLGAACEMGGFTRILHAEYEDDLMDEIPTFAAVPLPHRVASHRKYPVLDRPYAFMQWLQEAKITEKFILMTEPDYIFLRPIPNFMTDTLQPAVFKYSYIEPAREDNIPIVADFLPSKHLDSEEAKNIPQLGNAPALLTTEQMRKVVPVWFDLSIKIFKHPEAAKKWGWVQEMYAFSLALYLTGLKNVNYVQQFLVQTGDPEDPDVSSDVPSYLLHFTYPVAFTPDGNPAQVEAKSLMSQYGDATDAYRKGVWQFDKRSFMRIPPSRNYTSPPSAVKDVMVHRLIDSINEATRNIPCWDEYADTGEVPEQCDEHIPGSIYPASAKKQ